MFIQCQHLRFSRQNWGTDPQDLGAYQLIQGQDQGFSASKKDVAMMNTKVALSHDLNESELISCWKLINSICKDTVQKSAVTFWTIWLIWDQGKTEVVHQDWSTEIEATFLDAACLVLVSVCTVRFKIQSRSSASFIKTFSNTVCMCSYFNSFNSWAVRYLFQLISWLCHVFSQRCCTVSISYLILLFLILLSGRRKMEIWHSADKVTVGCSCILT